MAIEDIIAESTPVESVNRVPANGQESGTTNGTQQSSQSPGTIRVEVKTLSQWDRTDWIFALVVLDTILTLYLVMQM